MVHGFVLNPKKGLFAHLTTSHSLIRFFFIFPINASILLRNSLSFCNCYSSHMQCSSLIAMLFLHSMHSLSTPITKTCQQSHRQCSWCNIRYPAHIPRGTYFCRLCQGIFLSPSAASYYCVAGTIFYMWLERVRFIGRAFFFRSIHYSSTIFCLLCENIAVIFW